jgi:undecaprenyl-diphosphatase
MRGLEPVRRLDRRILMAMRQRAHGPAADRAVRAYSELGEHSRLWLVLAGTGAIADRERRPTYLRAVKGLVAAELVTAAMKRAVRRRRPRIDGLPHLMRTPSGLSYPSAHASTSFAAARVLSAALPTGPLYLAATLMACSRPYLGVHYPSDVVAGAALGVGLAELVGRSPS